MIALQDSYDFGIVFAGSDVFLQSALILRSNILRAHDEPGEDHHHWFRDRDSLVGSESPGEHNEVVGEYCAVHVGFEVTESFPVAA